MPAVLVHGVPDTHHLWDGVRAHLRRTDVFAPDLPGFGVPLPDGFTATKEEYAAWLVEQLEAVGEPVDLVGHDWGGGFVLRVATTRPDLVRTWSISDTMPDETYVWHDVAQMWQTPEVGEQVVELMTAEGATEAMVAAGVPESEVGGVLSRVDATMKDCILRLYRSAVNVVTEWIPLVDQNTRPLLLQWGRDDPFVTTALAEKLAARTGAQLQMFDDCGHWWPFVHPAEGAARLEAFWGSAGV